MKIEQWLKEKKVESVEKGHLAFTLVDMNFTEEDSFQAATECSSLEAALSFLQQECDLCAGKFSARQVSWLRLRRVNWTLITVTSLRWCQCFVALTSAARPVRKITLPCKSGIRPSWTRHVRSVVNPTILGTAIPTRPTTLLTLTFC